MKNKLVIFLLILVSIFLIWNYFKVKEVPKFPETGTITDGTIDSTYHYAWGENIGWVDFGSTAGDVHVTDSALSGFAYGENIGWIDLSTVVNTAEGVLSGYAWGENIGWVDFSQATIGTDGVFSGSAYGENIGWITFGTGDNKVATDWRPASARPVASSGSSGSRRSIPTQTQVPTTTPPPTLPTTPPANPLVIPGCNGTTGFSTITGDLCAENSVIITPPNPEPSQGSPAGQISSSGYNLGTVILRLWSRGEQVKELQRFLNKELNLELATDGVLGPKTIVVVKKWQKEHDLTADGIVGPLTREMINSIINQ